METEPASHVSLAEYLSRDDSPARELVAGEFHAKPMGTLEHRRIERLPLRLLEQYEQQGLGQALHELSIRRGHVVRIPDVVFYANITRWENGFLLDPPILCVEILSPSQKPSELFAKCEADHEWRVPYFWVIDPVQKSSWEYHHNSPLRLLPSDGQLQAGPITISLSSLG